MKRLILLFLLVLITSCNGVKKIFKRDIEIKKDNSIIIAKRSGLGELVNFEDIISKDIEIIRYEPVYYTIDGKDTVQIKQVIYRKSDTSKKIERTVKVDTSLLISKNNNIVDIKDNSENIKVVEKSKGFNYFLYGILIGILIILFLPLIKKLPIKLF
jgi:hypothetical protein